MPVRARLSPQINAYFCQCKWHISTCYVIAALSGMADRDSGQTPTNHVQIWTDMIEFGLILLIIQPSISYTMRTSRQRSPDYISTRAMGSGRIHIHKNVWWGESGDIMSRICRLDEFRYFLKISPTNLPRSTRRIRNQAQEIGFV